MSEFQPRLAQEVGESYEQNAGDVVISLSRNIEYQQDDPSWLDIKAEYIDSEGLRGSLEHTIHETCFGLIGQLTEPPTQPQYAIGSSEKERTIRKLQEQNYENAVYNAESRIAAKHYARGILGHTLKDVAPDAAERIVHEFVTVAVQAHEAKKAAEQSQNQ